MPIVARPGSIRRLDQFDLDVERTDVGTLDRQRDEVAGLVLTQRGDELVERSHSSPVDGDDGVAVIELVGTRDVPDAPLPVVLEALQVLDLHRVRESVQARNRPA